MKVRVASLNKTNVARSALGTLAALLVLAALGGWRLPLISGARAAFVALLGIGCMLCALGALRNIPPGKWSHPLNLVAILLGNLGALLRAAILSDVKLPLISSQRAAFCVVDRWGRLVGAGLCAQCAAARALATFLPRRVFAGEPGFAARRCGRERRPGAFGVGRARGLGQPGGYYSFQNGLGSLAPWAAGQVVPP